MNVYQTAPVVTLDPGDGQSLDRSHSLLLVNYSEPSSGTDAPPIQASGIDLSTLQVKLDGVDVTANFYRHPAGAASDGIEIPAGQHLWSVRIADLAGNLASNLVTFTATGQTNADAPVISNVNIGGDGLTILPASSEVWVQGKVSGTGTDTTVAASINGGEPILMNQRGEDFGAMLPLASGTNVIVLVATSTTPQPAQQSRRRRQYDRDSDSPASKTNQSSVLLPVVPSDFHIWDITPELGTFCDGHPQTVAGSMDPTFEGVAITNATINGQAALGWRYDDGSTAYYNLSATVPCPDTSEMTLKITVYLADGRQITMPFWYLEGYRIASKKTHYRSTAPTNICMGQNAFATFWWRTHFMPDPNDGGWKILSCVLQDRQDSYVATNSITATNSIADDWQYVTATNLVADPSVVTMTNWNLRGAAYCSGWGSGSQPGSHSAGHQWPWEVNVSLQFGTNNNVSTTEYSSPPGCGDVSLDVYLNQTWNGDVGELVVNWPLHYPTNQQVLLTIEGLDYTRLDGEAFNGSNVTLKVGETTYTPLVITNAACGYGYDLSYWVKVSGSSFTLSGTTFTWPTSTTNYDTVGDSNGSCQVITRSVQANYHHLSFRGFHNCKLEIIVPRGSPDSKNDNTCWYRGGGFFDFQGVTTSAHRPYSLVVVASVCSESCYNWRLDSWVGTLLLDGKQNTSSPTIEAPSVDLGDSLNGVITLDDKVHKTVRMYRDHLARDMENFGEDTKCGPNAWEFERFGVTVKMSEWNCHGSVLHAFNCSGYGNQTFPSTSKRQDLGWVQIGGPYGYPFAITNNLQRGDIVAFHTDKKWPYTTGEWLHSATCVGNRMLWGANNGKAYDGSAWWFKTRPIDEVARDYYAGDDSTTVYIFRPSPP